MTKQEAIQLSEVLKAYSEGKPIQARNLNPTLGYSDWRDIGYINLYDETMEYRVKSEQKYCPYANAKEFLQAMKEHGPYYRKIALKEASLYMHPGSIGSGSFYQLDGRPCDYSRFLREYVWQDGHPGGIECN